MNNDANGIRKKEFELAGAEQCKIRGEVRCATELNSAAPALVLVHGFCGFKDWGFFPWLAASLAQKGFVVVTFNFSHNGIGDDPERFTELELFKSNSFGLERRELALILSALRRGELPFADLTQIDSIGLVGHSRGGAAAICNSTDSGVRATALLASVSRFRVLSADEEALWRKQGVIYYENKRTGQQLPLGSALFAELTSKARPIEDALAQIKIPLCIIHGDKDPTVDVSSAEEIFRSATDAFESELHILPGADHAFGAKHPFAGETSDLVQVLGLLEKFFRRRLLEKRA